MYAFRVFSNNYTKKKKKKDQTNRIATDSVPIESLYMLNTSHKKLY